MLRLIISIIINIVLIAWFVIYSVKYDIGKDIIYHILKNKGALSRLHRNQMRKRAERKPLKGFWLSLSDTLKNLGFRSMLPGASPLWEALISLYLVIDFIILLGFFKYSFLTRLLAGGFILVLIPVIGQNICKKRTYEVEAQLPELAKTFENAAIQYTNVSEVFSNHYTEFKGSLVYACEEYYINLLVNKDEERSIKDFKDKFCSPMIDIVIENLAVGAMEDHDFEKTAHLLADTAEEYLEATSGNLSLRSQARVRVVGSLIFVLVFFFAGGLIAGGFSAAGLFSLINYEARNTVEFLPSWLQSGLGIYLLILSTALCTLGIYQKKGF